MVGAHGGRCFNGAVPEGPSTQYLGPFEGIDRGIKGHMGFWVHVPNN